MRNITNDGSTPSTTAPGLATAMISIWISSSEPLPSSNSMPSGTSSAAAQPRLELAGPRVRDSG